LAELSIDMKKTKAFVLLFFILAVAWLSFDKVSFLSELIQASLMPKTRQEEQIRVLAKAFFENRRLEGVIKERFSGDERLYVFLGMEMIKNGKSAGPQEEPGTLLSSLPERFPENIFLDSLNLYGSQGGAKDWGNFDSLFFRILSSPEFNSTSREILIRSVGDQRISQAAFCQLILFLSWRKNFPLAEDLLNWGFRENKLDRKSYDLLHGDWLLRKNKEGLTAGNSFPVEETVIENTVSRLLQNDKIKINWAANQISDGSFGDPDSLKKYWAFSDMADRPPFAKGSFYGDFDAVSENSLRVMGFFVMPAADKVASRAGFWYKDEIPLTEKKYLFYFRYKTLRGEERPTFYLSRAFGKEWRLEPADVHWREVYFVFDNGRWKIPSLRPLLRIWGPGAAWFDDVCLLEVESEGRALAKDILYIN
jgi:hypothetical protein